MEKLPILDIVLLYDWTNPSEEGACSDLIATWKMNERKGNTTGADYLEGIINGAIWYIDPQMGTILNFSENLNLFPIIITCDKKPCYGYLSAKKNIKGIFRCL
jgi:hypothetical protein